MLAVELPAASNLVSVSLHKDAAPTEIQRQVGAVAVDAVGAPNVKKRSRRYPEQREDKQ
jgi:hypothetical protein